MAIHKFIISQTTACMTTQRTAVLQTRETQAIKINNGMVAVFLWKNLTVHLDVSFLGCGNIKI